MATTTITATYNPSIFNTQTVDKAVEIILTPTISEEKNLSPAERWESETPYLMSLINKSFKDLNKDSIVIDFGCGIGRLAKELILQHQCKVVGVDISPTMRAHSEVYVNHPNFAVVSPEMFDVMYPICTHAIAIWTLQHVLFLEKDIERIKNALGKGCKLFVVNSKYRLIPTTEYWLDDKKDVLSLLRQSFTNKSTKTLNPSIVTKLQAAEAFWGVFTNK